MTTLATFPLRLPKSIKAAAEELSKAPAERVLLGDFNCADWSSEFRGFVRKTGLRDSRQGFGILPSWSPQGLEILSIPISPLAR